MKKFEIIDRKIDISDTEIESFMDFGSVLEMSKTLKMKDQVVNRLTRRFLIYGGLVILTGLSVWISIDMIQSDKINQELIKTNSDYINQKENREILSEKAKNVELIVGKKESKNGITVKNMKNSQPEKQHIELNKNKTIPVMDITKDEPLKNEKKAVLPIYTYHDAEPLEGISNMYQYFEENLIYPIQAQSDSIGGTVIIRFTITNEGKIDNIFIEKSLGQYYDQEAVRLIENMPLWKPATVNDVPVASRISIPLHFDIKN